MKIAEGKIAVEKFLSSEKILDNSLPDLSKHPAVIKKTERARAFLEKHPVPEHLLRK